MIPSFLLIVLAVSFPVTIIVLARASSRRLAFFYFPLGLVTQLAAMGIAASFFHELAIALPVASAFTWIILRALERADWRTHGIPGPRALGIVAMVASLALVDNLIIHAKNRWDFEPNALSSSPETYFRSPLQSDNQRNVMVVGALLRGNESPFLPRTTFTYQLQWHHFTALFMPLFQGPSLHAFVTGSVLATAFFFYFILWWGLCCLRPGLLWRPAWAIPLALVVLAHADLLNFAGNLIFDSQPGIEADGSALPLLGRHFSLKGTTLSAPQHLLLLLFLTAFFVVRHRQRKGSFPRVDVLFLLLGMLASPVFFFFFFPFVALLEWKRWRAWLVLVAVGYAGFWLISGFPLQAFLRRESGTTALWQLGPIKHWVGFPLLWVGIGGGVGLLATLLFGGRRREHFPRWSLVTLSLVAGTLFANLLTREPEIQRHWAILASLLCSVFVVKNLGINPYWHRRLAAVSALTIPAHLYFLHCYLGKPSHVDPTIAWRDYFAMNRVIESRFPRRPVATAPDPGLGLYLPPLLEVTTAWAGPAGPGIHSLVTPAQVKILKKTYVDGLLPYAESLGYELAVWGPVEQKVWGAAGKRRFLHERNLLARAGSVSLYRLEDATATHPGRRPDASPRDRFALAELLLEQGWNLEAIHYFEKGLSQDPDSTRGHFGIAFTLKTLGVLKEAVPHFEAALRTGLPEHLRSSTASALAESRKQLEEAEKRK